MVEGRPALDVRFPRDASTLAEPVALVDLVDAIVDDCHPYAIQVLSITRGAEIGAPGQVRRIHFFSDDDRAAAAAAISEQLGDAGVVANAVTVVDDGEAWAARSQANLRAIRVGHVVVAPPWDLPPDASDVTVVIVNPSMGFGTGHHATTRLCLRALQAQPLRGRHVTDVGTGSGVLAITAARLGAASVLAIENDEDAASAAQRNLTANDVEAVVTLIDGDVRDLVTRPASCVLANLTGPLLETAPLALARCAEPGGTLILSGLATDEEARVARAFEQVGRIHARLHEGDWAGLVVTTHGGDDA